MPSVLVLTRVVSGYMWRLFEELRSSFRVDVRVVHGSTEPALARTLEHDDHSPLGVPSIDSSTSGMARTWGFMDLRNVDAILILSTELRRLLPLVLAGARRSCPIVFASDANIRALSSPAGVGVRRTLFYRALAARVAESWVLGKSNADAFAILGLRRQRAIPHLSLDFEVLGAPAAPLRRTPLKLLTVARLVPEKNLDALVKAVQSRELCRNVHLSIAGGGPERAPLERLITSDNVSLLGARPWTQVGHLYRSANAVVLPSRHEPWGIVVMESLGMGVPVLATPEVGAAISMAGQHGGIRLTRGVTEADLVEGICAMLEEYDSLLDAAQGGVGRVRAIYDVRSVAAAMAQRFAELTGERDG